jgi:hypothetical protein
VERGRTERTTATGAAAEAPARVRTHGRGRALAGLTEAAKAIATVEAPRSGIRSLDLPFRPVDLVFWIAVAGVVVANLAVLWPAFTSERMWEDEAFNLTVPLNLLRGLGYSSDGSRSGSTRTS